MRSDVTARVERLSRDELEAYRAHPLLVEEHAAMEKATAQGVWQRQLYELIQNAADELIVQPGAASASCLRIVPSTAQTKEAQLRRQAWTRS